MGFLYLLEIFRNEPQKELKGANNSGVLSNKVKSDSLFDNTTNNIHNTERRKTAETDSLTLGKEDF